MVVDKQGKQDKPLTVADVAKNRMLKLRQDMSPQEVRKHIMSVCLDHGYNPVEELVSIAQNTSDVDLAAKIHMELLSYMAPKLKAMQVDARITGNIKVSIKQFVIQQVNVEDGKSPKVIDVESDGPEKFVREIKGE